MGTADIFFEAAEKFYFEQDNVNQPVPGYTWDQMADEIVPSLASDLACSGAYSEALDDELSGHFWTVVDLIERHTGRDLDKEASGQNI